MDWILLVFLVPFILYALAFVLQLVYLRRYRAERETLVQERERDLAQARELSHTLHQATHTPVRAGIRPPYENVYERYAAALDKTREANARLDEVIATSGAAAPEGRGSPFALLLVLPLTVPIIRWKREAIRLRRCLESEGQPVLAVRELLGEIAGVGRKEKAQAPVVAAQIAQAQTRIQNESKPARTLDSEKAELARLEQSYQDYVRLIAGNAPREENVEEAFAQRARIVANLQGLDKRIAAHERTREQAWSAYSDLDRSVVWLEEQVLSESGSRARHYLSEPSSHFRQAWRDNQGFLEKGQYEQAGQQIAELQQKVDQVRQSHRELRAKQQWIKEQVADLHLKLDAYQNWVDKMPKEFRLDASTPLLDDSRPALVLLYQLSEMDNPNRMREADELEARLRGVLKRLEENRTEFDARSKQYLSRRDGLADDAIAEVVRRAEKCQEELDRCHPDYLRSLDPVTFGNLTRDFKKDHGELRLRLRPVLESKFDLLLIEVDELLKRRTELVERCAEAEALVSRVNGERDEARLLLKDRGLVDLLRKCRALPRDWDKNQLIIQGFDERYRQCNLKVEGERENYGELVRSIQQLAAEMDYVATAYDEELRELQGSLTADRAEPTHLIDSLSTLDGQTALGLAERGRRKQVELRARLAAIPAICSNLHDGQALRERTQGLTLQIRPEINRLLQENVDLRRALQVADGSLADAEHALARHVVALAESPWNGIRELAGAQARTRTRFARLQTRRASIERRLPTSTLQKVSTELRELADEASQFCDMVDRQHAELLQSLATLDELDGRLVRAGSTAARTAKKDPTLLQAWGESRFQVERCQNQARRAATLEAAISELTRAQGLIDSLGKM